MRIEDHIFFENDDFVAVNKPSGLLTIADREGVSGAKNLLQDRYPNIFTVHRLDRETSGVVVFAKNEATHKELSGLFEGREVEKFYLGLILGKPAADKGSIEEGIIEHPVKKGMMAINKKGKASLTDYEVLESFRLFSWMQFQIHTGRTHQIRVHMKWVGNPIVCDALYGDGKPVLISSFKKRYKLSEKEDEERPILSRLALHSSKLSFTLKGTPYNLEAELPKDLKALLQQLRKNG
jgi:23S rRNA pseudouridine955/2504/2580 synthase/23S rRNA pseudouridine1911/1915/1917 synthase